jgi:hypothetical protein
MSTLKKILLSLGILIILSVVAIFVLEGWLVKKLPERINANPDRSYDLLFEDVDINLLSKTIVLKGITLNPLKENMSTRVTGSMSSLKLGQVQLLKFVFGKVAEIGEIRLEEPQFKLVRKDSVSQQASEFSKAIQGVFGDIVSRGLIRNFILVNGSGEFYTQSDSLRKFGSFDGFTITANNLETDSVLLNYAIPFQLESIQTEVHNVVINLDKDLIFRVNVIRINSKNENVVLSGASLRYDDSNLEASRRSDIQKDFIEVDLKELRIDQINAKSNIYGDWSLIAGKATIDSLVLTDVRNKNRPRPNEPEKPMFEGMAEKISFPLILDTILMTNSKIVYSQVSEGKREPGVLTFANMSAQILNFISVDSLQSEEMLIHAEAILNGTASLTMDVQVPYSKEEESFTLQASVKPFNFQGLSPMLQNLLSVKLTSGHLHAMELQMAASRYSSRNTLRFDYSDLKLEVLGEEFKKKGFMSTVANVFTSKENLPENKNYKNPSYQTVRIVNRGVFNLIWNSAKEGMTSIVPGDLAQFLLPKNKDK